MLFHPKNKKFVQVVWAIMSILVILSMVAFFIPVLHY